MPAPFKILHFKANVDVLRARRFKRVLDQSRSDDECSIFEKRLTLFDVETIPVLDVIKDVLVSVDSDRDLHEIVTDVEQILK